MKGNFIDRHLLRGCDLEWPTLFQQSSIGDLANKFCFLFLIERWAATSADSIWNLKNRIIQIIGGRTHLGAPHQHFPIFIGRRKETAVWWKSHWPDPTWMSGEFAWIRRYYVHLHVPNIHFAIRTSAAPKLEWIDEQIRKKVKRTNPTMNQRVVPDSTLRCQSKQKMGDPPRSVATGSGWSIDQICQMQKKKSVAAADGHRSSERHLDGSVVGAAKQSTIFRIPTERIHNTLCDESKTLIQPTYSFIYLMIEAP